jgi:hypothetical protein
MSAGFAVLGVEPLRRHALTLAYAGWVASILLLWSFPHVFVLPGIVLDLFLVWATTRVDATRQKAWPTTRPSVGSRIAAGCAAAFLAYTAAVIALRPWFMRYGTSAQERQARLFGDSLYPGARYRVDNAITIRAPADSVWPWLAQIGQDRGGFYSYTALENLAGARIRNANMLVPAWQDREVGELVRAVPRTYLGGRFGAEIGWHIVAMEPGRALVLENWGAFIVLPVDSATSRLYIRQRNPGVPTLLGNTLAPLGLLVFEPAHFIMQRGMLRGIKKRAERRAA